MKFNPVTGEAEDDEAIAEVQRRLNQASLEQQEKRDAAIAAMRANPADVPRIDPATGRPYVVNEVKPRFDPATGLPLQPDPMTIGASREVTFVPAPKFDPQTGARLYDDGTVRPKFDPQTGVALPPEPVDPEIAQAHKDVLMDLLFDWFYTVLNKNFKGDRPLGWDKAYSDVMTDQYANGASRDRIDW